MFVHLFCFRLPYITNAIPTVTKHIDHTPHTPHCLQPECLFVSKFTIVHYFVNPFTVVWLTTLMWSMMTFWKFSELSVLMLLFLKFHLCLCSCLFSTWFFISSATGSVWPGVFHSGFGSCSITVECATSQVWPGLETDCGI